MRSKVTCDEHSSIKKKKKESQAEKQNDADDESENKIETTLLDVVPESGKKKKKHKKKRKERQAENKTETSLDVVPESGKKRKHKKKRKERQAENKTETSLDVVPESGKKRKHKKKKKESQAEKQNDADDESENKTETTSLDCVPESGKKKHKKKGKESQSEKQNNADDGSENKTETISLDVVPESGKTKHKKKRHTSNDFDDNLNVAKCVKEVGGKRKLEELSINTDVHKKLKTDDCEQISHVTCEAGVVERKAKRKRKKEKTISTDPLASHDNNEPLKKKLEVEERTFKTDDAGTSPVIACPPMLDESEQGKVNKKQNRKMHLDMDVQTQDMRSPTSKQDISSICDEESARHDKKNKHKKKQKHNLEFTCDNSNHIEPVFDKVHLHKTKQVTGSDVLSEDKTNYKANKQSISNNYEEESTKQRKKQKKHPKDKDSSSVGETNGILELSNGIEGDNNFLKNGNESSGRSQLNTSSTSSISTATVQGQWQGNLFESNERQNKFLRLLGGMKKSTASNADVSKKDLSVSQNNTKKKGLFGSLASLTNTGSLSGNNLALSATAAANLDQKLEDDYNRAMDFRLGGKRGTGFGFVPDPAQGKTFHIDVHKSKSVKFDD